MQFIYKIFFFNIQSLFSNKKLAIQRLKTTLFDSFRLKKIFFKKRETKIT